jgi:hypothetical protein
MAALDFSKEEDSNTKIYRLFFPCGPVQAAIAEVWHLPSNYAT